MARKPEHIDHLSAVQTLKAQITNGKPRPQKLPETLNASEIITLEAVFQHRATGEADSFKHAESLARALKLNSENDLDPVVVLWAGKKWACVDGHHRLKAYKVAGRSLIPVTVFEGSLEEAILEALVVNNKDNLSLDKSCREKAAWRLVIQDHHDIRKYSKKEIVGLTLVGEGTVANMRRAIKKLTEQYPDKSLPDSWKAAKAALKGITPSEHYDDRWRDKKVTEIAGKLIDTFGHSLVAQDIEIIAEALELYSSQLFSKLTEHLQKDAENDDEFE